MANWNQNWAGKKKEKKEKFLVHAPSIHPFIHWYLFIRPSWCNSWPVSWPWPTQQSQPKKTPTRLAHSMNKTCNRTHSIRLGMDESHKSFIHKSDQTSPTRVHPQVTQPVQPECIHKWPNQSNQNSSTSVQTSPTRMHPQVTKPVQPEFIHKWPNQSNQNSSIQRVGRYLGTYHLLPACLHVNQINY
jgi:hypothetical protein